MSVNEKLTFLTLGSSVLCWPPMAQLGHTSKRTTAKNNKLTQKQNDFSSFTFRSFNCWSPFWHVLFTSPHRKMDPLYFFIRYTMECGVKNLFNIRRNVAHKPIATIAKIIWPNQIIMLWNGFPSFLFHPLSIVHRFDSRHIEKRHRKKETYIIKCVLNYFNLPLTRGRFSVVIAQTQQHSPDRWNLKNLFLSIMDSVIKNHDSLIIDRIKSTVKGFQIWKIYLSFVYRTSPQVFKRFRWCFILDWLLHVSVVCGEVWSKDKMLRWSECQREA